MQVANNLSTARVSPVPMTMTPVAQTAPRPRVCVVAEDLSGPPDEGIKKFTLSLAAALAPSCELAVLATEGASVASGALLVRSGRSFLSGALRAALRRHRPEVVVYVARSSTTFMSVVRSRLLKAYCPSASVVLVGLQARRLSAPQRILAGALAPDLVCVQSSGSLTHLRSAGCTVDLVPSGVNLDVFSPVPPTRKRALRAQYGLAADVPVALHVGHLKTGRGVRLLAELAARRVCQVVLVTSTSTAQDHGLAAELTRAGVRVMTEYQPHVEHLYQLADCYVFPVESTDDCIEVPLSILEAFACDLPVVTTRFAGLPERFGEHHAGLTFVDSGAALVDEAARVCRRVGRAAGGTRIAGAGVPAHAGATHATAAGRSVESAAASSELPVWSTRDLALPYSWDAIAARLLDRALPKEN
jgi:glycosyltransferase involved in cell wall biosynthesis